MNVQLTIDEFQDIISRLSSQEQRMTKAQADELLSARKINFNESEIQRFQLNQAQKELEETKEKLEALRTQGFCKKKIVDIILDFARFDKSDTVDNFTSSLIAHIDTQFK